MLKQLCQGTWPHGLVRVHGLQLVEEPRCLRRIPNGFALPPMMRHRVNHHSSLNWTTGLRNRGERVLRSRWLAELRQRLALEDPTLPPTLVG